LLMKSMFVNLTNSANMEMKNESAATRRGCD
jgi:hypothetical protein